MYPIPNTYTYIWQQYQRLCIIPLLVVCTLVIMGFVPTLSTSASTVLALRWSVFILFSALPNYLSRCFFSFFLAYFLFIAAHREMRTTTNFFLLNLSVADLLMSSLNCMFNFIYMLNSDWPFGSVYCSVNNFMGNVTVATSVFTLVAISFNRYVEQFKRVYR